MSTTKLITALSAEFGHTFFKTGFEYRVNEGLKIVPAGATADLLRGARMMFRQVPKGFSVMYSAYPDPPDSSSFVPYVEIADGTELTFAMTLSPKNRDEFMNYTKLYIGSDPADPDTPYSPEKIVFLSGSGGGALSYSLIDALKPDLFTVDFQITGGSSGTTCDVTLQYESETAVQIYNDLPNSNLVYSAQVDLRGKRKGKYTFTATPTAGSTYTATFYVDKDLYGTELFGIIRVAFSDSVYTTPSTAPVYTYTFAKRTTRWRYFVVLRGQYASQQLKASGTLLPFTPSEAGTQPGYGIPDTDIRISGYDTFIFLSDDYIAFEEEPLKIKLELYDPIEDKLVVGTMPNPALNGFDSDRYAILKPAAVEQSISEMFVFVDDLP